MHRRIRTLALLALLPTLASAEPPRHFTFEYESEIGPLPATGERVQLFVPVPRDSTHQRVVSRVVEAGRY